ncbi:MAG: hydrogenase maturation protease [Thermoplasmata archaeon]
MALVILGLGNDLLGDDAIGLLAAERLERRFGPRVNVRRSAQSGLYLLEHLQGFDDAIIIDSVLGEHPGRVRELAAVDMRPVVVPSAHYAGLSEALALARASGLQTPGRVRIFAVEMDAPQTIGSSPGPAVMGALPELVARVEQAVREWGYA